MPGVTRSYIGDEVNIGLQDFLKKMTNVEKTIEMSDKATIYQLQQQLKEAKKDHVEYELQAEAFIAELDGLFGINEMYLGTINGIETVIAIKDE